MFGNIKSAICASIMAYTINTLLRECVNNDLVIFQDLESCLIVFRFFVFASITRNILSNKNLVMPYSKQ